MKTILLLLAAFSVTLCGEIDFNNIPDNSWIRQPRASGNQGFGSGGDVHAAFDNSGLMYIFGGCTSYNGAGGSHNADIYRINIETGWVDRIANCSSGWWRGGCQRDSRYPNELCCNNYCILSNMYYMLLTV